jgi:hypothetical protein
VVIGVGEVTGVGDDVLVIGEGDGEVVVGEGDGVLLLCRYGGTTSAPTTIITKSTIATAITLN